MGKRGDTATHRRRRYKNPPVEEAVCEIHFAPGGEWDLTVPGKLQSEIGGEYSGKPREQKAIQVDFDFSDDHPPNLRFGSGLARVQLANADGNRMVGVGPDILSVHMLRPYQDRSRSDGGGWDEFRHRIASALDAYWNVAEPAGVRRVGIRYINKITIAAGCRTARDYLECSLPEVAGLPDRLANFVSRVEYVYPDGIRLVLTQGSVGAHAETLDVLLDLDVIWEDDSPVDKHMALEKAGELYERERAAFESVITAKARGIFDAD